MTLKRVTAVLAIVAALVAALITSAPAPALPLAHPTTITAQVAKIKKVCKHKKHQKICKIFKVKHGHKHLKRVKRTCDTGYHRFKLRCIKPQTGSESSALDGAMLNISFDPESAAVKYGVKGCQDFADAMFNPKPYAIPDVGDDPASQQAEGQVFEDAYGLFGSYVSDRLEIGSDENHQCAEPPFTPQIKSDFPAVYALTSTGQSYCASPALQRAAPNHYRAAAIEVVEELRPALVSRIKDALTTASGKQEDQLNQLLDYFSTPNKVLDECGKLGISFKR